jgi:hypothetical protein
LGADRQSCPVGVLSFGRFLIAMQTMPAITELRQTKADVPTRRLVAVCAHRLQTKMRAITVNFVACGARASILAKQEAPRSRRPGQPNSLYQRWLEQAGLSEAVALPKASL